MTSSGDDELLAELRRSLAGDAPRPAPPEAQRADPPADQRPPVRPVSSAAMAIADQIMGLEAAIAGDLPGPARSLALRSESGLTVRVAGICIVGRRADADLTVTDGRVSRSHAEAATSGGRHVVRDLGSSNGTFLVRGDSVRRVGDDPTEIAPGDRLETIDGLLLADVVEVVE